MRVKLLREGARAPSRAHPSDAGYDLYYCGTPREIWPHTVQVLGCGIAVDFDTADPDGSLRCGLVRDWLGALWMAARGDEKPVW